MKKAIFLVALLISATCLASKAAVNVGLSLNKGVNSFYLSIGDYFSVPQRDVMVVRQRHIPDEEIPVVFFLAQRAKVAPSAIINLRLKGKSWIEISFHYGLGPEIFYVPVDTNRGFVGPYGHAYEYYRNKPRREWKKIRLGDADIVNLVNLKFMSEHYNYPPVSIMKMREGNKRFYDINNDIQKQKHSNMNNAKAEQAAPPQHQMHNGGHGHGRMDNAAPAQAAPDQHQMHNGGHGQGQTNNVPSQTAPDQSQKHNGQGQGHGWKNNGGHGQNKKQGDKERNSSDRNN